jgi:hypothetical protein
VVSADSHIEPGVHTIPDRTRRSTPALGRRLVLTGETARYLGGASILVVGAIHAQQYYQAYFSAVPTIGTLFLLSSIGAAIVGVALLAPVRRLGRHVGDLILTLAALGAIGIAIATFVSLLISEYAPLFGFMESRYRLAIVLTLLFDALTSVFLGFFLLVVEPRLVRRTRSSARLAS